MSYAFGNKPNKRNMIIVAVVVVLVLLGGLLYLFKDKFTKTTGKAVLTQPANSATSDEVVSKSKRFRLEHTFGEVAAVPGNQD